MDFEVVIAVFDRSPDRRWETMGNVLAFSLRHHGYESMLISMKGPKVRETKASSNVSKLRVWNQVVQDASSNGTASK